MWHNSEKVEEGAVEVMVAIQRDFCGLIPSPLFARDEVRLALTLILDLTGSRLPRSHSDTNALHEPKKKATKRFA